MSNLIMKAFCFLIFTILLISCSNNKETITENVVLRRIDSLHRTNTNLDATVIGLEKILKESKTHINELEEKEKQLQNEKLQLQSDLQSARTSSSSTDSGSSSDAIRNLQDIIKDLETRLIQKDEELSKVREEKNKEIQRLTAANGVLLDKIKDLSNVKPTKNGEEPATINPDTLKKEAEKMIKKILKEVEKDRFFKISSYNIYRDQPSTGQASLYLNKMVIDYTTKQRGYLNDTQRKSPKNYTIAICIVNKSDNKVVNPKKIPLYGGDKGYFEATATFEVKNKDADDRLILTKENFGKRLGQGTYQGFVYTEDEKLPVLFGQNRGRQDFYWEFTIA